MQRNDRMKRLKKVAGMTAAIALSAVMTTSTVYAEDAVATMSAYGFASSPAIVSGEQETLFQKAAKLGYGQIVEKSVSDSNGELTVHNMLVGTNAVYADLSYRAKNVSDDIRVSPRLHVRLNNDMIEKNQMWNYDFYEFTDTLSMYDQLPGAFQSVGYSMMNDSEDKGLYKISVNGETSDDQIQTVYFDVDRIDLDQDISYTHTVSEWLKNPAKDIKVSIDYNDNELFVRAESNNYVRFVVEQENGEQIWNQGGSSFGNEDGNVTTAYWDLKENAFNPDTIKLTATYTKQLEGEDSDLSIEVKVNQDKTLKPIYSKELNKTITSTVGDLKITNIKADPLNITLTYEKDYNPDTDRMMQGTPAPEPYAAPHDLQSYKAAMAAEAPAEQAYVSSEPEFKILTDGEELFPRSGSFVSELGGKTKGSLVFNGMSLIESFTVSVLQADGTYLEVPLDK